MMKTSRAIKVPIFLAACTLLCLSTSSASNAQSSVDSSESLKKEAMSLLRMGKVEQAASILGRVVEASPLCANNHYLYGETLFRLKKYPDAAAEFKQAQIIDPNESLYPLRSAESYLAAGNKVDAVATCESGLSRCQSAFYKQALLTLKQETLNPPVPQPVIDPERTYKTGGVRN